MAGEQCVTTKYKYTDIKLRLSLDKPKQNFARREEIYIIQTFPFSC